MRRQQTRKHRSPKGKFDGIWRRKLEQRRFNKKRRWSGGKQG